MTVIIGEMAESFIHMVCVCMCSQAFPDNAARREVEALAAVCPNEGCTWTGTIKEFEVRGIEHSRKQKKTE